MLLQQYFYNLRNFNIRSVLYSHTRYISSSFYYHTNKTTMPAIRPELAWSKKAVSSSNVDVFVAVSPKQATLGAPITRPVKPTRNAGPRSGSNGFTGEDEVTIGKAHEENTFEIPDNASITEYQKNIYDLLLQIPPGKVSTYKYMSEALASSPRAVGTALRRNPFAPDVPCHRVIASTYYIGGFMGDWKDAPSGINITKKLELLEEEGVEFDEKGYIKDKQRVWKEFDVSWKQKEEED
ncbi:hypothetical protein TWF694_008786 [Orbilia ellipsospora]|uniref:Methylated-DNA--protein-cysteine methyltransferase n=1 Tax=Orbilia ellipsospora TaxID=2528407 RepID=A0AAV9XED7_9PEZI